MFSDFCTGADDVVLQCCFAVVALKLDGLRAQRASDFTCFRGLALNTSSPGASADDLVASKHADIQSAILVSLAIPSSSTDCSLRYFHIHNERVTTTPVNRCFVHFQGI